MMHLEIAPMEASDSEMVQTIYGEGIATGDATFETVAPGWDEWDRNHLRTCRLVARSGSEVVAWGALSPVSGRCVYGGVAEVSVYVAASHRGQGIGKALLQALVEESERGGIWTLQSGIFPENEASIALHQRCGFRIVGRRERLGQLHGVWRDVILMERRSRVAGV
jgi:L-amino acid N-acyltransferase YncA